MSKKVHDLRAMAQRFITDAQDYARVNNQKTVREWFHMLPDEKQELMFALTLHIANEVSMLTDDQCGDEL